jgi:hypothetical protein
MADDAGIPSFDDFSAAYDRARDARGAGQQIAPADMDIIRRGNSTHYQQYLQNDAAAQAPPSPAPSSPSPPSDVPPASDPNSWWNIAKRAGINTAMAIPDVTIQGGNVLAHAMGDPSTVGMPSQWLREKLGVPDIGENASTAQKALEFAAPIVAGSLVPAGAAAKAASWGGKGIAALESFLTNAAARPALSMGGAYVGQKLGGETGEFLGGLAGGMLPEWGSTVGAKILSPLYRSTAAARGNEPSIPAAGDVADAAARLSNLGKSLASTIGPAGERYAEEFPMTYGMAGNRAAKISQAELAEAGAGPAYRAQEAPQEFLPRAAELAIIQRRELPPATPGNQEVINLAQQARASAVTRGVSPSDVYDRSTLDAMQGWINSKMGNQYVDVTPTHNLMQDMIKTPGGAQVTQLPAGPSFQGQQNTRAAIAGQADALRANAYNYNGRLMVPYQQLQDWKSGLGLRDALAATRPNTIAGLAGDAYDRVYGSIRNDIANSAPAGVSPEALNTAVQIEHRELSARDQLPEILKYFQAEGGKGAKPGIASVLNVFPKGQGAEELYSRATGGPYNPAGAPSPVPGSGDIRQTLADIATLHNATAVPGGVGTGATGWWQKAKEGATSAIPFGLGEQFGSRVGGSALGAGIGMALGLPAAPMGGAALGFLGGPFGINYARAALQQNPRIISAMTGRPTPSASSASPLWSAPAIGTAIAPAVRPATPEAPWTPPPWTSPIPGRQSLRTLPTTSPILAAWNRANVGRSRAETAP